MKKRTIVLVIVLSLCLFSIHPIQAQRVADPGRDANAEIEDIRKAIADHGAHWEAAMNSLFLLPAEDRRQMCGALDSISVKTIPSVEQVQSYVWHPEKFDWRNKDGQNWMTSVRDQGRCGSCVAFGTLSALEGQLNIYHHDPKLDLDLSEQHLFNCGGGTCDVGWYTDAAYQYLQNTGVPDEACFPYTSGTTGLDEPCANGCPDWRQRVTRISCFGAVGNNSEPKTPAEIKDQLLKGPMTTVMTVFDDFFAYRGGVYEHVSGNEAGGHAICFVGWDDTTDPPCWIVRNSWGLWGEAGYFRIRMGTNECGIESNILFLSLGPVPKGRSSDTGHLFGKVALGHSEDWSFSLLNEGEADLEIYGFAGDLADFFVKIPTSFPQTIPAGGSLGITATFAPTDTGFRYDRIRIQTNSCRPLQDLKMRGEAIIHSVHVTPGAMLETLAHGQLKKAPPVSVSYSGNQTLHFTVTVLKHWLAAQPAQGELRHNETVSLDISLDGSQLDAGEYNTNILFKTDDLYDQVVVIPVRVIVQKSAVRITIPSEFRTVEEVFAVPVWLDNAASVQIPLAEVSLRIGYDENLLQLHSVDRTTRTAGMSGFQWDIVQPGLATVQISDRDGKTIDVGSGSIADLRFSFHNGSVCEQTASFFIEDVFVIDTSAVNVDVRAEGGPILFLCKGDCTIDGIVNILDVVAVINHILAIKPLADGSLYRADCNGDAVVDILDTMGIVNIILGTGSCTP